MDWIRDNISSFQFKTKKIEKNRMFIKYDRTIEELQALHDLPLFELISKSHDIYSRFHKIGSEADHVLPGLRGMVAGDPARARGAPRRSRRRLPRARAHVRRQRPPPGDGRGRARARHRPRRGADPRWTPALGRHVTYVGIEGARHDVVLSLPNVRKRVYGELERWVTAYVD